jgi:hypothetical protein
MHVAAWTLGVPRARTPPQRRDCGQGTRHKLHVCTVCVAVCRCHVPVWAAWYVLYACVQHRDRSTFFAFIVGNEAYHSVKVLTKCRNDAEDMRDLLVELGYPSDNVVTLLDATKAQLLSMLQEFTRRLDGAIDCHVLLFYSGHGLEVAGDKHNYLLPIDVDVTSFAGAVQLIPLLHSCGWVVSK